MSDKELNEILDLIRVNYKNFFKTETASEKRLIIKTWKYQFSNIPQDMMFQAVMQYMATEPSFPPTIGHVNKLIVGMTSVEIVGAEESYSKIKYLINKYGSGGEAFKIACKEFNDIERLVINNGYYKELGQSTDPQTVLFAHYRSRYNNKKESVIHNKRIELPSKDILQLISERKLIGG